MNPEIVLKHEFVQYVPTQLADRTVYISIAYSTATHKCCCGCGNEVITQFSPTDWKLIFDGETISLEPSIGNWSFPCRSHYWIRQNRVKWARPWSKEEIEKGRKRDKIAKESYFGLERKPLLNASSVTFETPENERTGRRDPKNRRGR